MAVTVSIFTKLRLVQKSYINYSYTAFHENRIQFTRQCWVTDSETNERVEAVSI
jgi:hypothetical protein